MPPRADVDEQSKKEIKDLLLSYDRTLLVADPRRCEPKKCAQHTPVCPVASARTKATIRLLTVCAVSNSDKSFALVDVYHASLFEML